jgi:beta-phosphoglucomutase-like phosphatase (HAD superfamily)
MIFNHVANRLDPRHFETIVAMLTERLGFVVLRRTERSIWLRQPGATIDLQFSRSETANRDADKQRSQVAFLSETPRQDLAALAEWLQARGLAAAVGAYSYREFFLDAPDAFVDFVIEAMRPELADYGTVA